MYRTSDLDGLTQYGSTPLFETVELLKLKFTDNNESELGKLSYCRCLFAEP